VFDLLTVHEWDKLCSKLESALMHPAARLGVAEDIAALHGELMLTWQARLVAEEWHGNIDGIRIPTGTGWPA
jgi:hypothetical protein